MAKMWPSDDYMEIGETGWIPTKNGCYVNKHNGHTIDEMGKEYDEEGNLIFDPNEYE